MAADDRIIKTKLVPPTAHPLAVDRDEPMRRLGAALARDGTVVVASMPGYGKRDLIARWIASQPAGTTIWLSLDGWDDLPRLIRHLVAAVQQIDPSIGHRTLESLDEGIEAVRNRGVPSIVAEVDALRGSFTAVIEGAHRLVDADARMVIRLMQRFRVGPMALVFVVDDEAAVDLRTEDGTREIAVIGERELRFGREQVVGVFAQAGIELAEVEVDQIVDSTGGWPLAVLLAAERSQEAGAFEPFDPAVPAVADRLHRAICQPVPIELRPVLSDLAVLGPITSGRFEALTERPDTLRDLERLQRLHLAVVDGGRVSAAPAALAHLLHEREITDPKSATLLRRRLAHAHADEGRPSLAVRVLEEAGDHDALTRLLLERHLEWSSGANRDLVDRLIDRTIVRSPGIVELHFARAWLEVFDGDDRAARSSIETAAAQPLAGARRIRADSELEMLRAVLARREGRMDDCLFHAIACEELGESVTPDPDIPYASVAPDLVGMYLGHCLFHAGELEDARAELLRANVAREWSRPALAALHGVLGMIGWLDDDPSAALHAAIAVSNLDDELTSSNHLAAAAFALVNRGDDADEMALRHAAEGERLAEPTAVVVGHVVAAITSPFAADARRSHAAARAAAERCEQPGVLSLIVARAASVLDLPDHSPELGADLTDGERRVVRALRGDLTEREIGAELNLSHNTVRAYRRRAYRKLGVVSRADAIRRFDELDRR